jgi:hypothetical protein
MFSVAVAVLLPFLLVFGLYHLLTWFNVFRINERVYWKRVALASAISHILLATGFFIFSYFDYQANRSLTTVGLSYGAFLFNRSDFWRLISVFDTLAMACILAFFTVLDRLGIEIPAILAIAIAIVYAVGTVQWYFVGGAVGALVERFWHGLKSGEDEDEDFF